MRHFLDTNVLLYSVSTAGEDAAKRAQAIRLLQEDDGALSVQVLQEFYVQVTRATRADRLSHQDAVGLIGRWIRFPVQEMTLLLLRSALDIRASHRLSYWDSAIVAAAIALGCRELYTEDMSHGQEVEGVLILDPFR